MPVHDWSRVTDGMFHWFHQRWIGTLSDWLNQGRLPEGYYAVGELYSEGHYPDVLTVEDRPAENRDEATSRPPAFGVALAEAPPRTRYSWHAETEGYLTRQDLLAVRTVAGTLVAVIEILSAGNKSSQARFRKFVEKTIALLDQGVHVLVVDLFPPTARDPHGVHEAIWREAFDGDFSFEPDKPLTLASYLAGSADSSPRAFVEPIAVGDVLPPMSLFLWPTHYVLVDLETTYAGTWAVYPDPLKRKVESAVTP